MSAPGISIRLSEGQHEILTSLPFGRFQVQVTAATNILSTFLVLGLVALSGAAITDAAESDSKESASLISDNYSWPPALYGKLDNNAESPMKKLMEDLKTYLAKQGVTFPDGSILAKGSPYGGFTMTNTAENHKILESHLLKVSEDHRQRRKIQNRRNQDEAPKP